MTNLAVHLAAAGHGDRPSVRLHDQVLSDAFGVTDPWPRRAGEEAPAPGSQPAKCSNPADTAPRGPQSQW
jgi:hypothetical protein